MLDIQCCVGVCYIPKSTVKKYIQYWENRRYCCIATAGAGGAGAVFSIHTHFRMITPNKVKPLNFVASEKNKAEKIHSYICASSDGSHARVCCRRKLLLCFFFRLIRGKNFVTDVFVISFVQCVSKKKLKQTTKLFLLTNSKAVWLCCDVLSSENVLVRNSINAVFFVLIFLFLCGICLDVVFMRVVFAFVHRKRSVELLSEKKEKKTNS